MKLLECPQCHAQVYELLHYVGYPGEYCHGCAPEFKPNPWIIASDDLVNGVVIGQIVQRFEFWTTDNHKRIARISCETQERAIEQFKAQYPAEFATGAILRIYED